MTSIHDPRTSKTELLHWRGCIFQRFQHLQTNAKTDHKICSQMIKEIEKTRSGGLPKTYLKIIRKNMQKHTKKGSQNEVPKSDFFDVFKGLGPRVFQGGPRDTPRTPKVSPKVPKWSPKHQKSVNK